MIGQVIQVDEARIRDRLGQIVRGTVEVALSAVLDAEGYREIPGIFEGAKEDKSGWSAFSRHLVDRGLKGFELIASGACGGRW